MADTFLVKIDLERMRANLERGEGRPVSKRKVRDFLFHQGFIPRADGWVCEEISLRALNPDEILACRVAVG